MLGVDTEGQPQAGLGRGSACSRPSKHSSYLTIENIDMYSPPVPPSLPWSALLLLVLPRVRRREAHRPVDQVEHQEHDGEHNKEHVVHLEQLFTLVLMIKAVTSTLDR